MALVQKYTPHTGPGNRPQDVTHDLYKIPRPPLPGKQRLDPNMRTAGDTDGDNGGGGGGDANGIGIEHIFSPKGELIGNSIGEGGGYDSVKAANQLGVYQMQIVPRNSERNRVLGAHVTGPTSERVQLRQTKYKGDINGMRVFHSNREFEGAKEI